MNDVAVRVALALSRYQDGGALPMAKVTGVDEFFFDDSLICLKQAGAAAQAEAAKTNAAIADQRASAEKDARAEAEADRARLETDAKAKVDSERAEIEANARAAVRAQIEADLRAKAEADAKIKADVDAKADIEAASTAKDKALVDAKATEAARLEAEAVARNEDKVRRAKAEADAAARAKADADARIEAQHEANIAKAKAAAAAAKAADDLRARQLTVDAEGRDEGSLRRLCASLPSVQADIQHSKDHFKATDLTFTQRDQLELFEASCYELARRGIHSIGSGKYMISTD